MGIFVLHTHSVTESYLRNHRENPGTLAELRANLCPKSTVGTAWWSLQFFWKWCNRTVPQSYLQCEHHQLCVNSHTGPGPWQLGKWLQQWLWDLGRTTPASAISQHGSSTFPVHPTALTLLLLSQRCYFHRVATFKNYKTSSKVELTALPSSVLENVTRHVFHNTSKIAFKPSNSYQSLIFHHIPPNKLIPAFHILCLRTTYPFPTHPDQPLHSELTPNPSPNTLLLPDHSSQPFFYPSHTIFSI